MLNRHEILSTESNLSEPLCQKIKDIYYPQSLWINCYRDISNKFSTLKKNAIKFFKTEKEMLQQVAKWEINDIRECIDL